MDIFKHHHTDSQGHIVTDPTPTSVPEIDASSSVTALTLLAMIEAIITARRSK